MSDLIVLFPVDFVAKAAEQKFVFIYIFNSIWFNAKTASTKRLKSLYREQASEWMNDKEGKKRSFGNTSSTMTTRQHIA